jgi:glycosyltransferase involved in cell wall biosynthesis
LERIPVSVVIPTCDRSQRLLSLLENLDRSSYLVDEVIIVDSGNDRLQPDQYVAFTRLPIQYVHSEKSVCIQRNMGIQMARSAWILLCDDDIEVPTDYLRHLIDYLKRHPEAGAVSGRWLQKEKGEWTATYPVTSARSLLWKYIFQLGIWGEINCARNIVTSRITDWYKRKGNHISKAGWPVNTDFSGDHVICPVYSLGASLVKKEWLLQSAFDEVLDRHGIGDNYGVAVDFPGQGIHIVNDAFIYHHLEPVNRLKKSLQYYRRTLALDYFISTKSALRQVRKYRLVWSLTGNLINFLFAMDGVMTKASVKAIARIIGNSNPYTAAKKAKKKVTEPML